MSHPDEGLIHAWLDGELDAAEAARVEALVASDAAWAAAAAEARGLIAASARIVGALDRVPANVIPNAAPARPVSRRWVWRAAAVLALMAGSAVVLERETPVLPVPIAKQQQSQQLLRQQPEPPQLAQKAKVAAPKKNPKHKGELADAAPTEAVRDKDFTGTGMPRTDSAGAGREVAKSANAAGAERRAPNAPMAAAAQTEAAPAAAPPAVQSLALQKFTRLEPSCFAQRAPADSATRIIRLSAAALADSISRETLVLRGDTLAAVNGRLRAVRVPCPAP